MDFSSIGDWISNFGFPIVLSFVLLYYIIKSNNQNGDRIQQLQEVYDKRIEETQNKCNEQINRLSDSLDRNTEVMNKLLDKFKLEGD